MVDSVGSDIESSQYLRKNRQFGGFDIGAKPLPLEVQVTIQQLSADYCLVVERLSDRYLRPRG